MQPLHRFLPALAAAATLVLPLIAPAATGSAFAQDQQDQKVHKAHAIAMHGEPKYGPDAPYFDHLNPNALKGGTLTLSAAGTFDTFNPFNAKGTEIVSASCRERGCQYV